MMDYVKSRITDNGQYFILLDDVQYMDEFGDVLNHFLHIPNVKIFVTVSSSNCRSTDIMTEFRGRGFEIQIHPLCFREFVSAFNGNENDAWDTFFTYGGLPGLFDLPSVYAKITYLNQLFKVYIEDIRERHAIRSLNELDELLEIIASSIGTSINPNRLTNTFASTKGKRIDPKTIRLYLEYFKEALLVGSAKRYDIRGKKYISTQQKYYFEDVGLRNVRLGLRQQEPWRIMENIIFNELREYSAKVDVGR